MYGAQELSKYADKQVSGMAGAIGAARVQSEGYAGHDLREMISKAAETKRPELAEYMERLAGAMGYTEELVQTLEKRLSMISAPSAPTTGSQGAANPAAVTYYGQQLNAAIERLSVVNATIRNMLDRLEA